MATESKLHAKKLISEYIFYGIALAFALFIRIRFSDMSFERDEGEYAYAGAEILRGGFPYLDFYNMKLPGVYYCYALIFFLFGKSVAAVRLSVMVLCVLNSFFIQKIGQKWLDARAGWLAAGIYLITSIGRLPQGMISNAEHFVLFFFLAAIFCLSRKAYFIAGVCAALSLMMKQHALILLVFFAIYFLFEALQDGKAKAFLKAFLRSFGGFSSIFAIFIIALWQKNAFPQFKFLAIDYARYYVNEQDGKPSFFPIKNFLHFLNENEWFWSIAFVGILMAISAAIFHKKMVLKTAYNPILLILLGVASYAAVLPGGYLRPHYFLYTHPAMALLAGYCLSRFYAVSPDKGMKMTYILVLIGSLSTTFYEQLPVLGKWKNGEFMNYLYGDAVFNELREVGQVIKLNAQPNDYFGQVANEPEVAFYADIRLASGFLYNYPLYEKQPFAPQMMDLFFAEMEKNRPRWYLKCLNQEDWRNALKQKFYDWSAAFEKAYALRGVVYQKNHWEKDIQWNVSQIDSSRKNEVHMLIFERGDSASLKPLILK